MTLLTHAAIEIPYCRREKCYCFLEELLGDESEHASRGLACLIVSPSESLHDFLVFLPHCTLCCHFREKDLQDERERHDREVVVVVLEAVRDSWCYIRWGPLCLTSLSVPQDDGRADAESELQH